MMFFIALLVVVFVIEAVYWLGSKFLDFLEKIR